MKKKCIMLLLASMLAITTIPITQCYASGTVADVYQDTPFDGYINFLTGYFQGKIELDLPSYTTPRVTAVHSCNAALGMWYNPKVNECPFDMESRSLKINGAGGHRGTPFAVAYTGYWNAEVDASTPIKVPSYAEGYQRELDILGKEILISNEEIKFSNNSGVYKPVITTTNIIDENITLSDAYIALYKTLDRYEYKTEFAYNSDSSLGLATSPISRYLNVLYNRNEFALDTTYGETLCLITRSNKEAYRERIIRDSGILDLPGCESATDVTNPLPNTEPITLAEFCVLVKNMMQEYGEPVLTSQEEVMLTQIYGKTLPYYVADSTAVGDREDILNAIKYLIAKGILNPDRETPYDFSSALTLGDMLQILASVKDEDSRYTFKYIDITIDAELQNMGYYETNLSGVSSPILNVETNVAATDYFDYLVKVTDDSNFMIGSTLVNDRFCLVSKKGKRLEASDTEGKAAFVYKGQITYNGASYYHFKIKAGDSYIKEYLHNDTYLKISTMYKKATSKYYYLKKGGGNYDTKLGFKGKKIHQARFSSSDIYVDANKKKMSAETMVAMNSAIKLAPAADIPIRFSLSEDTWKDDIKKIQWKEKTSDKDGVALSDLVTKDEVSIANDKYKIRRDSITTNGLRYFTVTGCKDLSEFRSHIVHDNPGGRYNEYQTFCQNGENILVNYDYLQDVGIAKNYIELKDDVLLLTTKTNNIYLCPKQKWIIVGNVAYDMPSNSLMYYKKDGKLFIDYRAATGWSSDYYVFQDNSGQVTLSLPARAQANSLYGTREVYTPIGSRNSSLTVQVMKDHATSSKDGILLSSTYPLANYFVFDGSEEAGSDTGDTDYLFVFKLKSAKLTSDKSVSDLYKKDTVAKDKLLELTGLEPPKDWLVYVYQLHKDKDKANPPGIYYEPKLGYYYVPPSYNSKYKENYYNSCLTDKKKIKGTATEYKDKDDIVLPFVQHNNKIYDINFNMFKYKDTKLRYGGAPVKFLRTDASTGEMNRAAYWKPGDNKSTIGDKDYGASIDAEVIMAPTGVLSALASLSPMTSDTVLKSSYSVYVGTMKANVYKPASQVVNFSGGAAKPTLKIGDLVYGTIGEDIKEFRILRSTNSGYVLGVLTDIALKATDEDRTASAEKPIIGDGLSLIGFNWEQFTFRNLLEDADDFITIATIALLNFLPRIAIFIFISLIGLSLITNVRIWVLFCDNIFDIYKFVTFKRRDVHTIDTFTLFWTSILAIAAFGLFMDGTIINIIAWLVRFGVGVITK